MKYLKKFVNTLDYEIFIEGDEVALPNVSVIFEGNNPIVMYNPIINPDIEYYDPVLNDILDNLMERDFNNDFDNIF